jgi:hypothetical protein
MIRIHSLVFVESPFSYKTLFGLYQLEPKRDCAKSQICFNKLRLICENTSTSSVNSQQTKQLFEIENSFYTE